MQLCDYGCGQEAKHQFKNGKWCCSINYNSCPFQRKIKSKRFKKIWQDPHSIFNSISCKEKISNRMKEVWADPNSGLNSVLYKKNQSNIMKEMWEDPDAAFNSKLYKEKLSSIRKEVWKDPLYKEKQKLTIEKINKKHSLFSKIEEMRYNPDKPGEKEIQVHCKNHNCKNSKEKGGWFTPTGNQIDHRIRALEKPKGFGESNFYCSQHCKDTCILFRTRSDPLKDNNLPYTQQEIQVYNKVVLERENGLCEYCGEPAEHVHHIFPQKLEPFFALDPDYGVACCKKHHYEYGHEGECSTGNLAKIICSVESQKFLNQKI